VWVLKKKRNSKEIFKHLNGIESACRSTDVCVPLFAAGLSNEGDTEETFEMRKWILTIFIAKNQKFLKKCMNC
jgi:hypothetical protein